MRERGDGYNLKLKKNMKQLQDDMDLKFMKLEEKLFNDPKMIGFASDQFKDEYYIKTMSDGGGFDEIMADLFEAWLKENNVIYNRVDYRHFKVNRTSFENALKQFA